MSFMHFDAHTAAAGIFSVNLSGTPEFPRQVFSLAIQGFGDPVTAHAAWVLAGVAVPSSSIIKGDMNKASYNNSTSPTYTSDTPATDWITDKDFSLTYWARGTLIDGDAPAFISGGDGVWNEIIPDLTNFTVRWSATGGFSSSAGIIQLDLAQDNMGSPGTILTTGYYRGIAETEI